MSLSAISAIDGRYETQTAPLSAYFSEYALIRFRVHVEIEWLVTLCGEPSISDVRGLTDEETAFLRSLASNFSESDAHAVKAIEKTTNHDVKAVEYWIKSRLADTSLADVREWVHFACTSEDINNLAHALMLKGGMESVFLPSANDLVRAVADKASETADVAMLARTHGQSASPTTVGKELAVFVHRWRRQLKQIAAQEYLGKLNGAVGNFNAHLSAYPDAPWETIARQFVEGLGLTYNPLTTQIESHDYMAELFHTLTRFLSVLLDFDRDVWGYVSLGYFKQATVAGEVGSSTMPHKVNPIDFENSEANVGLASAILGHLAEKLMVSRWQRDLSDSSAIRSVGTGIGHAYLAVLSARRGLKKVSVNQAALEADLNQSWEVLAEPIQTVMRKAGLPNPYETLKDLTRGAESGRITPEGLRAFVQNLQIPETDKARLLEMTPASYVGIAPELARRTATEEGDA